jgi:sigma-B regulation protein RsbU (phosphoserine phosphatase)
MADSWETQLPPRLVGYESWIYQMPCIDRSGDVFVSVPLPSDAHLLGEPPNRWLVALGDVSGKGEIASRLKYALETEVIRLAGTTADPASILKALNSTEIDPAMECRFATLQVVVIDSGLHELTLANAGCVPPLLRHADRRVESLAEKVTGIPLWVLPEQTCENAAVPIGPREVVSLHSDPVAAVIDHLSNIFDLDSLRLAIAQAPSGAASVGQSILEAMRRFGQGQAPADDITLLCLGRVMP